MAVTLSVVLLAPASIAAGAAPPRAHIAPDLRALFYAAVQIVRVTNQPTFSDAVMLEADGLTANGQPTTSADGIVSWNFFLDNHSSGSSFLSASVSFGPLPARFGQVTGSTQLFVEDKVIPRVPRMPVSEAVARLHHAGYGQSFYNVTLRNPMGPNQHSNPLYIFGFADNTYVAVDTVTGKVAPFS